MPPRWHEAEPAPDAWFEPKPKTGQDDQRHRDPACEKGRLRYLCDRAVQIAQNGDAEHQVERSDKDALLRCSHARKPALEISDIGSVATKYPSKTEV